MGKTLKNKLPIQRSSRIKNISSIAPKFTKPHNMTKINRSASLYSKVKKLILKNDNNIIMEFSYCHVKNLKLEC